jgi:hypothetical protein
MNGRSHIIVECRLGVRTLGCTLPRRGHSDVHAQLWSMTLTGWVIADDRLLRMNPAGVRRLQGCRVIGVFVDRSVAARVQPIKNDLACHYSRKTVHASARAIPSPDSAYKGDDVDARKREGDDDGHPTDA